MSEHYVEIKPKEVLSDPRRHAPPVMAWIHHRSSKTIGVVGNRGAEKRHYGAPRDPAYGRTDGNLFNGENILNLKGKELKEHESGFRSSFRTVFVPEPSKDGVQHHYRPL